MTLFLLSGLVGAMYVTSEVSANPVPYPLISMPQEYIYANLTVSDENAYARVNTTYPFTENDFRTVSMSYPLPINSTNVNVKVSGNETYWWYTNQTYETVYGNMPVINWTISPAPNQFVVNVNYDHEVPKVGQNFTYFYAMGTWKSLEGIYSKRLTAYVTVDVNNMNISDTETLEVSVYQIGCNSITGEWIWKLLNYGMSKNNEIFRISVTVESFPFTPILDDLVIALKKAELKPVKVVPDDYAQIRSAIYAANYGDTILVTPGTYYEHLDVWKPVHLIGQNAVIDGNGTGGDVVRIAADNVDFCGFTVESCQTSTGCTPDSCGLVIAGNGCNITNNTVRNNRRGIFIYGSNGNVLRNNTMTGNFYNFNVASWLSWNLVNDVDASNRIDGKPICYWVGQNDKEVPQNAAYVAVVDSDNITVKDLRLSNNGDGVLFFNTHNSLIESLELFDNHRGITLKNSHNNTVTKCQIFSMTSSGSELGIDLLYSDNNTVAFNYIKGVRDNGVRVHGDSNFNNVYGNTMCSCLFGMFVAADSNAIYHNNFMNSISTHLLDAKGSNTWNYEGEGNYWSGYSGPDSDKDGIGDTPYTFLGSNVDYCPLMGMFSSFDTSQGWPVEVVSNSTIDDFQYFEPNSTIRMHASNMTANQTMGFCRIAIPHALVNETYHITIDGTTPFYANYSLYDNGTHRWIYVAYQHSTREILIVPELIPFLLMPTFMMVTLLAVIVFKRESSIEQSLFGFSVHIRFCAESLLVWRHVVACVA